MGGEMLTRRYFLLLHILIDLGRKEGFSCARHDKCNIACTASSKHGAAGRFMKSCSLHESLPAVPSMPCVDRSNLVCTIAYSAGCMNMRVRSYNEIPHRSGVLC